MQRATGRAEPTNQADVIPTSISQEYDSSQGIGADGLIYEGKAPIPYGISSGTLVWIRSPEGAEGPPRHPEMLAWHPRTSPPLDTTRIYQCFRASPFALQLVMYLRRLHTSSPDMRAEVRHPKALNVRTHVPRTCSATVTSQARDTLGTGVPIHDARV